MRDLHLLLAAAGKDPPLIDLDSTVFLQLAIFVVLAFLLNSLLFQPYLKVRAAREQGVGGAEDAAKEMDAAAKSKADEVEARVTKAKAKANDERAKLRTDALGREREVVTKATSAAQSAIDAAKKKLEGEATAARAQLEPRAKEIGKEIATKLLGREVA
jgi:F-type H+-transporting ATPase subunit b